MSAKLIETVAKAMAKHWTGHRADWRIFKDFSRAAIAAIEASGTHRVVPVVATKEMIAGFMRRPVRDGATFHERYADLLAAAPKVAK